MCQEGVDRVSWTAHNVEWCSENPKSCQPKPPIIPYDEFFLKEWSEIPMPIKPCEAIKEKMKNREFTELTKQISIGILTRGNEIPTLQNSMNTWIEGELIQQASEVIIMVNEMNSEMMDFLDPYTKEPYNMKIIYSYENEGILKGINWLMGNSTNEYFLFLEKDFRLVEELSCTIEQLDTGIELIESGRANVIKYRSRYNPGRPNWAEISYKGREDDIFSIQPNLLCNFYHWIDEPVQRWPNHFERCSENPLFFCVDSKFCNWTNNPFLVSKIWWFENYVFKFEQIKRASAGFDLEGFMNWDRDAWNDRGWTVAEGEGMFKHCDANNFGQ